MARFSSGKQRVIRMTRGAYYPMAKHATGACMHASIQTRTLTQAQQQWHALRQHKHFPMRRAMQVVEEGLLGGLVLGGIEAATHRNDRFVCSGLRSFEDEAGDEALLHTNRFCSGTHPSRGMFRSPEPDT